jgi:hypothetical protein
MKQKVFVLGLCLILWQSIHAAPLGTAFTYQGRLMDGTNVASGEYDLTFALFDSLSGTNQLGVQEFIEKEVIDGLLMFPLDFGSNAFNGQARWLEISVRRNESGDPYTKLLGRQQLFPVPYSLLSVDVPNGVITSNKLAVGAVTRSNLAPFSVTSDALASSLALGGPGRGEGLLDLFDGSERVIQLDAEDREVVLFAFSGRPGVSLGTGFGGEIRLFDNFTNDLTVCLSSGAGASFDSGGLLELFSSSSSPLSPSRRQVNLNGGNGGQLELYNRLGNRTFLADGAVGDMVIGQTVGPFVRLGAGIGIGLLSLSGPDGAQRVEARADARGEFRLFSQTIEAVTLRAGTQPDANSGGSLFLRQPNGTEGVRLYANGSPGPNPGGLLNLFASNGTNTIALDGGPGQMSLYRNTDGARSVHLFDFGGGALRLNGNNGQERALLYGANSGGSIQLHNSANALSVDMRSQFSAGNTAAWVGLNDNGAQKITFAARNGSTGLGGLVGVFNGSGTPTILLTGDTGAGKGRVTTSVLQITGGSDLSEQFEVGAKQVIQPGMVVCIDPQNPGKLVMSTKAHDRTVAGIVSGAGGVNPGMLMGQQGTVADGKHPVALTGRVYCLADAGEGAIEPGDLLTSSETDGHAMRASDHARSQGAIIGKAMTPLPAGQGLVLVLVSLQ